MKRVFIVLVYPDKKTYTKIMFPFFVVGGFVTFFSYPDSVRPAMTVFESFPYPLKEKMTKRQTFIMNVYDLYLES